LLFAFCAGLAKDGEGRRVLALEKGGISRFGNMRAGRTQN